MALHTTYINGKVFTVNRAEPWVQAFTVSPTGKFIATGDTRELLATARRDGHNVVDLGGSFVMPGIHDAHTHLLAAALQQLYEVSIGTDSTHETIAQKLNAQCQCLKAHLTEEWLIANFYHGSLFPNGQADRKYLDEAFPDTPVVIRDISCHNVLANTEALKRAKFDLQNEVAPPSGKLTRRDDGSLTGELIEQASTKLWLNMPKTPMETAKGALLHAIRKSNEWGITSCQEASGTTVYLNALRELEKEERITCDIHTHIVYAPVGFAREAEESLHRLIDTAEQFESEHVKTRFVKFWLDGAPLPPYYTQCDLVDGEPQKDKLILSWEYFVKGLKYVDRKGYTSKVHCAGDGSVRFALDAIEAVRNGNPNGPRHELAHCNKVHTDDMHRFESLRVTAEMSPAIFHEEELIAESSDQLIWPFEALLEAGTHLTIGSDWILPPTPNLFPALQALVPRLGAEEVLRLITLSGAEAVGRAEESGSIQIGKKANFIQLDRDLTRESFTTTVVHRTWFEGQLVWEHPSIQTPPSSKL